MADRCVVALPCRSVRAKMHGKTCCATSVQHFVSTAAFVAISAGDRPARNVTICNEIARGMVHVSDGRINGVEVQVTLRVTAAIDMDSLLAWHASCRVQRQE